MAQGQRGQVETAVLFQETIDLVGPVLKRSGKLVLGLAILLQFSSQVFQFYSQMESETIRLVCAINQFLLTGLLWPTLFILIVPVYARDIEAGLPTHLSDHMKKHFSQLVIESFRVLGKVTVTAVLWMIPGLLVIAGLVRGLGVTLPGWVWFVVVGGLMIPVIYKTFQLYFVPFIVQFSKHYDAGVLDALQGSTQLWNMPSPLKNSGILLVVFLINGLFQYGLTVAPFWESPVVFTVLLIFLTANEVFCDVLIYRLYRKLAHIHGGDLA